MILKNMFSNFLFIFFYLTQIFFFNQGKKIFRIIKKILILRRLRKILFAICHIVHY
jgi:hypothetical protein